jgi:hypothetical protein
MVLVIPNSNATRLITKAVKDSSFRGIMTNIPWEGGGASSDH